MRRTGTGATTVEELRAGTLFVIFVMFARNAAPHEHPLGYDAMVPLALGKESWTTLI